MNVDYSTTKWLKLRQMVDIQQSLVDSLTEFEQLEPSLRAELKRTPDEIKAQRVLLEAERSKLWEWQGKFDVYEDEMKRRLTLDQDRINTAMIIAVLTGNATTSWAAEVLQLPFGTVREMIAAWDKEHTLAGEQEEAK